jgi:hypothetical protein
MPCADDEVQKIATPSATLDTTEAAPTAISASDETTGRDPDQAGAATPAGEPAAAAVTQDQLLRQQRRAWRLSRYDEVLRLHAAA